MKQCDEKTPIHQKRPVTHIHEKGVVGQEGRLFPYSISYHPSWLFTLLRSWGGISRSQPLQSQTDKKVAQSEKSCTKGQGSSYSVTLLSHTPWWYTHTNCKTKLAKTNWKNQESWWKRNPNSILHDCKNICWNKPYQFATNCTHPLYAFRVLLKEANWFLELLLFATVYKPTHNKGKTEGKTSQISRTIIPWSSR